jgi:hypothetical protein
LSRVPLTKLAAKYFRQNGYSIKEDAILEGFSGLPHKFDLIIRKGKGQQAVWIREWKRTVGINVVINIDKASEDVGFPKPIIISDKFSSHAKAYANRRGITLLSRRQIRRMLG